MAAVNFFIIRNTEDPSLYWSTKGEWTNNHLGAALLTARQREQFPLPEGGEFLPFKPGEIVTTHHTFTVRLGAPPVPTTPAIGAGAHALTAKGPRRGRPPKRRAKRGL